MLIEKFEIFLALLAGLIVIALGFFMQFSLPGILLRLLIVLVVFYIVGLAAKTYLRKRIFVEIETNETDETETEDQTNEENVEMAESTNNAENQPTP